MLTINGTSPKQIIFNGTDLTKVYARETASDTPVLVWTKYAISITGNRFYLGDAIHNQIRIYQNGVLKDTIAAGFSGNKDLSFTLASGNSLLVQIYNSSGWSQNIYNGSVSSSTWYYENFTETTHTQVIPNGNVECSEYVYCHTPITSQWKIRWPDIGLTFNWTLSGKVPVYHDDEDANSPIPTMSYVTTAGQAGPNVTCTSSGDLNRFVKTLEFTLTSEPTSGGVCTLNAITPYGSIPSYTEFPITHSPGPNIPFTGLTFKYYEYTYS